MLLMASAHASTTLQAASVSLPGISLQQLDSSLATDAQGQLQLILSARNVTLPAMGWKRVGIQLQGQLQRERKDVWSCNGTLSLDNAPGGLLRTRQPFQLVIDTGANTLQFKLGPPDTPSVLLSFPLDQLSHVQAHLLRVPLSWLQGPLSSAWNGRLTSGSISATLAMDFQPGGLQGSAFLDLVRAGVDGGSMASDKLGFKGRVNFSSHADRSVVSLAGNLKGGEVLLGSLYASLPSHTSTLSLNLTRQGGRTRIDQLRYRDPGTLSIAGGLALDSKGNLQRLDLNRFDARFPAAYQHYAKTWLATQGLRDLKISGQLSGAVELGANGLANLDVKARSMDIADGAGRFRVEALNGGIDWGRGATRTATMVSWKSLGLYRIPLGAGSTQWRSERGALKLRQGVSIPVLDGQLGVHRFSWQPDAKRGNRADMAVTLTGVDMARFSRAMGWPAFRGTLAGAMPGLHYADGRLQLQGGLSLNVFGGFVDVTSLSLVHPFGETPELSARIGMQRLDLGAMTEVFHFGKITGPMHGHIDNLHLVDWKPVSFDAQLLADQGGHISQRAVNNLTSVGGGSTAGGLQGAVLRLFKNFRYSRIGLHCTLQGNICRMGGLEPEDGGYLIVEGSGLPHLTVIGHQHEVSWPTLVSRLRAAIRSGGPVMGKP